MPLSDKDLSKAFTKLEVNFKSVLKRSLSEISTFQEVMEMVDKLD